MQMTAPTAKSDRAAYLADLLARAQTSSYWDWLQAKRSRASVLVQEQAIPSTRDEEWRFTDLSPLLAYQFQPATAIKLDAVAVPLMAEAADSRLVFVNGIYAPELSNITGLTGAVKAGYLADFNESIQDYFAQQPGYQEVFSALNTASFQDAALVQVPKNLEVAKPLHLVFISTASEAPTINQPRCLVIAEAGSSLTLVEEYISSAGNSAIFTNAVTEIYVGENARVNHSRMQLENPAAFHIGKTAVSQARNSSYTCNAISLGAQISRHNLEIFQTGAGTETELNGLTKIAAEQLADTHSTIALNHPHGVSRQLHKCIAGARARAVFNGKILVPKPAQLTNAAQLSRNLLLSPKARVDTKPQLEITADNVKCAHGATVSQLEADEIFYLQSRGINADAARELLINAFAAEIILRVPVASVRERLFASVL